ncbi:MAG: GNAT family N-acetyltransferase [Lachnospiraceae bacterium]|nr:GNAT family N-acetyltransferase [Lachnospiraceae bacterium]
MEAFVLTKETVQAFFPLLPEEFWKLEQDESIVLLGAAESDAADENRACGTMVLRVANDRTLLIPWLLTAPEYRRRGAGRAMLELAMELAGQMNMQLLCIFSAGAEAGQDAPVYRFFQKHGFILEAREAKAYSIPMEALGKETFFLREQKPVSGIMTLEETPVKLIADLNRTLAEKNHLLDGPISKERSVGEVSLVQVEHEVITSCVIFRELGEHTVELSFAYSGKKASMQMPMLLLQAQRLLSRRYGPETELVIPCVTEASRKLVEALAPSAAVTRVSYGAYRNTIST